MSTFVHSTRIDGKTHWYIFDDVLMKYLRKDWTWNNHCNEFNIDLIMPDKPNDIGFYKSKEEAEKHLAAKLKRNDKFTWSVDKEKKS